MNRLLNGYNMRYIIKIQIILVIAFEALPGRMAV